MLLVKCDTRQQRGIRCLMFIEKCSKWQGTIGHVQYILHGSEAFGSKLIFSKVSFVSEFPKETWIQRKQHQLLHSWRFSRYRAPIHWLVHGHMTSNDETVSRQMPWASNISKTITSNGKQFTIIREMLTVVARDQRWPDVVAGISAPFSNLLSFCFAK